MNNQIIFFGSGLFIAESLPQNWWQNCRSASDRFIRLLFEFIELLVLINKAVASIIFCMKSMIVYVLDSNLC